jgi:hypothetical protein
MGKLNVTFDHIAAAIDRNFPGDHASQTIKIMPTNNTASLPTCVLGIKTGIYTLDGTQTTLHFAGNQIRDDLLESYRTKLAELNMATIPGMQSMRGMDKLMRETVRDMVLQAMKE